MSDTSRLAKLSDHLFVYADICNAYVVCRGKRALVIDCGAGDVRKHLRSLGAEQVEWLLFTHHHREQSQGAEVFTRKGSRVAVPEHEAFLFEDAQNYMRNRAIYDSYNDRATANTRILDLPVDEKLEDYETFTWRGFEFSIVPTPGHTLGSISLIANIDGRRVAFTGDLLREEGRFHSLHDLEYSYGGAEGADLAGYSATRLAQQNIDLICPSHGSPIDEVPETLDTFVGNCRSWYRWKTGDDPPFIQRPVRVTQHITAFPSSCCAWYALVADDGHALFIDHGAHDWVHFNANAAYREFWETQRYIDHGIHELRQKHGLRSVDVVIPTHYHDDHVCGFPYLQKHHGTEVWCVEQLKEVLEHPERYSEMCLFPKPVNVNRTFRDGEQFEWKGFEFQVWHFPGQTEYHQIIMLDADGRRILFTGDSIVRGVDHASAPVIFRNNHRFESHAECAEKLALIQPNLIAPGHGDVWAPRAGELASFRQHVQQLQTLFRHILPEDQRWEGINPFWVRFVPHHIRVPRGKSAKIAIRVVNSTEATQNVSVSPAGPPGISFEPGERNARLAPGATRDLKFQLSVSQRYSGLPRAAIAADVTVDDEPHGQAAEAFVEISNLKR